VSSSKRLYAGFAVAAALAPAVPVLTSSATALASSSPALVSSTPAKAHARSARERALLDSHELWATIDVCNPADQRNTVGIRGSMPGDGQSHDRMYMSFRLQYMNASKH